MIQTPADPTLLRAISKMYVAYLPRNNRVAVCNIIATWNPVPPHNPSRPVCTDWTQDYAEQQARDSMVLIHSQADALSLLGLIAKYGVAIHSADIPPIQACITDLDLSQQEYAYLWDSVGTTPFCQVRLSDGSINYDPILHVKDLAASTAPGISGAVEKITQQYEIALPWFSPDSMRLACNAKMTYHDMGNTLLQNLCGCYISIQNDQQFAPDEKSFLAQYPQCISSCLTATVKYTTGGGPIQCSQSVCIADKINVKGDTTTITQVCPQCPKPYTCICYVHVNGQLINNKSCNTVYEVDDSGHVTSTTHNQGPTAGAGIKRGWKSMIKSPAALIAMGVAALLIAALAVGLLLAQHMRGRTHPTAQSLQTGNTITSLGMSSL